MERSYRSTLSSSFEILKPIPTYSFPRCSGSPRNASPSLLMKVKCSDSINIWAGQRF